MTRLKLHIHGAVQGVGFRPFVYRVANELELNGWVSNGKQGVRIEAEGNKEHLTQFLMKIQNEKPPHAHLYSIEKYFLDPVGYQTFEIKESDETGTSTAWILPDIAVCPECLEEVLDPDNRRYRYPFTNCTHCGPRYSIIQNLPYDRKNTTMHSFKMCPDCREEYENPANRRFHAQPNACPVCGPHVELLDAKGVMIASGNETLQQSIRLLASGKILAVKGLGGFHLMADATNDSAVERLRERKQRAEKPFAIMVPDLASAKNLCVVSDLEAQWLASPEAPILLLERKRNIPLSPSVAPDNPYLGLMLPYTPLHHLILKEFVKPLVATSGNLAEEPICTDNKEALDRLGKIADFFLMHNRPIARPVDDSVGRVIGGRPVILRRARGMAPLPIPFEADWPPMLSVGAHLKNTVAMSANGQIIISQHIGDLEKGPALHHFKKTIEDLKSLYQITPEWIVHDLHPDYASTHYAEETGLRPKSVQHHLAHAFACMVDNEIKPPAAAVVWDGTGFGSDETIWGGEFFNLEAKSCSRIGTFRTFRLPGGDKAAVEPRRSAIGILSEIGWTDAGRIMFNHGFSESGWKTLVQLCGKPHLAPRTSSVGRLFDAVAALLNVQQINYYEAQAAMQLEFLASSWNKQEKAYPFQLTEQHQISVIDWEPMLLQILNDIRRKENSGRIAYRFHITLTEMALTILADQPYEQVVLSGGCFQNKLLTELLTDKLNTHGFSVHTHQRIPPNDGGISAGQILAMKYPADMRL